MSELWGRYDNKWTELSLKELANFAKWMNEILGHHPIIIGGWAVYFYNPTGLGSRDVDVIFPTWEMRDRVATLYLVNNGYELKRRAFGEAEWIKLLEPDNPDSETYLDICTLQDKNLVHGRKLEIPWSIATRWRHSVTMEGEEIFIPDPEPLLVLKVKAAWDRNYDLMKKGGDTFLSDKIRKDRFDILSILSKCEINRNIVAEIVLKHEFKELFVETLGRVFSDYEVIERHGFTEHEIAVLEDKIKKIFI